MLPCSTEQAGARDGVWAPGRRALTLGLVLMITLVAFEAFAIATVMPKIKDDLGGIGWYGWVFSAFFLANLLGIVWAGHSSDHHGPARAFTVGLLLFALGLLLGGVGAGDRLARCRPRGAGARARVRFPRSRTSRSAGAIRSICNRECSRSCRPRGWCRR